MAHATTSASAIKAAVPATPLQRWLQSAEAALWLVEIPAALLVVAEIVILFAGVVSRYGFRSPLIWSDELASILFLWLAMFGAVVAFRRAEHMRMTAVVAKCEPGLRAFLDMVGTWAALAFLLMIVWPSYEYAYEESFITTPALQIPNSWRAAALPIGVGLMVLFALLRLMRQSGKKQLLMSLVAVAGIIAVFWFLQPVLRPLGNLNLIIFFVGVVALCVFAGVPIAFAFGLSIFGYLVLTTHAADGAGRTHGRGHEPSDPAGGAAVRVPRSPDRDDRHGAGNGGVSGQPARPCARRPALRADRRDVSGVGHFRLEGRRHGRRCAGAVS
jgi:TRAP-type C4-dicarboxylate transport system permease small subunit